MCLPHATPILRDITWPSVPSSRNPHLARHYLAQCAFLTQPHLARHYLVQCALKNVGSFWLTGLCACLCALYSGAKVGCFTNSLMNKQSLFGSTRATWFVFCKNGNVLKYFHETFLFISEKGLSLFEVLPEGWVQVTHTSGMPIFLHKPSRVCSMSKPYFLGRGSARVIIFSAFYFT